VEWSGVPQGSILGPLLFIIYINDILNATKIFKIIQFADDTCLFHSGSKIDLESDAGRESRGTESRNTGKPNIGDLLSQRKNKLRG